MKMTHCVSYCHQRGIAAVMAVIFLIMAVIFVLTQTLNITGMTSIDNKQQLDSTAALFLAESGLENATAVLRSAGSAVSGSTCAGIATGHLCGVTGNTNISLDSGRSYCYTNTPVSDPDSSCAGGSCVACTVTVTGKAGSATRTINRRFELAQILGISGNGGTVTDPPTCSTPTPIQMALRNNYAGLYPGTAIFNLAFTLHSTSQPAAPAGCTSDGELWFLGSNGSGKGTGTIFGYSDWDKVAQNLTTVSSVRHGFTNDQNYAMVGVIFPNTDEANTTPIGQYWHATNTAYSGSTATVTGTTNSGVALTGGASCTTPSSSFPTSQACTTWCNGADTLVYGFNAAVTTPPNLAASLSDVKFDTGTGRNNISMTKQVHFPGPTDVDSPGSIYSDIWYVYNPAYTSEPLALNSTQGAGATSYPKAVKGTLGATFVGNLSNNSTNLVVSNLIGQLCDGDVITGNNKLGSGAAITTGGGLGSGACSTSNGTYKLTVKSSGDVSGAALTAASTKFHVLGKTGDDMTLSATNEGVTLQSGPTDSQYTVTGSATTLNSGNPTVLTQGSSGNVINVPTGSLMPVSGTIVSVYSGTGSFAGQTKVLDTPVPTATQFSVSVAPATGIKGAIICGGICAFFNQPSSTTSTTQFTVTTVGTSDWSSGFTCLKGVLADKIYTVPASTTARPSTWREIISQ